MREIPGGDGGDDADRFPDQGAPGLDSHRCGDAEIGSPRVVLGSGGTEFQIGYRALELGSCGQHPGSADLGHGDLAQFLDVIAHGVTELADAPDPQGGIGRPVACVECPTCGFNGTVGVGEVGVGGSAEHLLGGRIDVGVVARAAADELPVNEQITAASG